MNYYGSCKHSLLHLGERLAKHAGTNRTGKLLASQPANAYRACSTRFEEDLESYLASRKSGELLAGNACFVRLQRRGI